MSVIITIILSIFILPILCIIILGIANSIKNLYTGTTAIMRKLPMPPRYPIIGHIGKFDPRYIYLWTHEQSVKIGQGINYGIWLGHECGLCVTNPDDLEYILGKGQHEFTKAAAYGKMLNWCIPHGLLITDGDEWKAQRATFNPSFHWNVVRNTQDHIFEEVQITSEICDEHVNNNTPVDIALYMETLTLDVLGKLGFNINFNAQRDPKWRDAMRGIMVQSANRAFNPLAVITQRSERKQSLLDYYMLNDEIRKVYDARLQDGIDDTDTDLLAQMQRAEDAGAEWVTKYTNGDKWAQYRDQMGLFLFAGSDTTSSLLTSTIYMLAKYPEYRKKVQSELDKYIDPIKQPGADECSHLPWLNAVIKETLRLRPSVSMNGRRCFKPLTLPSGQQITPQMNLLCLIYTLHRNTDVWGDDAEQFVPERWLQRDENNNELILDENKEPQLEVRQPHKNKNIPFSTAYIPFAGGNRNCIGQNLARLEASVSMAILLRRFEFTIPSDRIDLEPAFETAITMQYTEGLPMNVTRRCDRWKVDENIKY